MICICFRISCSLCLIIKPNLIDLTVLAKRLINMFWKTTFELCIFNCTKTNITITFFHKNIQNTMKALMWPPPRIHEQLKNASLWSHKMVPIYVHTVYVKTSFHISSHTSHYTVLHVWPMNHVSIPIHWKKKNCPHM